MLSWDNPPYSLLISDRVPCFQSSPHNCSHLAVIYKFVAVKILLQRWEHMIANPGWQITMSVRYSLKNCTPCQFIFWPTLTRGCCQSRLASSSVTTHLPVLGAYPLYRMDRRLSCTASMTSTGGFKLPKTVGSPENVKNLGLWFQQERLHPLGWW